MSANNGEVIKGCNVVSSTYLEDMQAYDNLSPEMRALVRDLPLNEAALPIIEAIDEGRIDEQTVTRNLIQNYHYMVGNAYHQRGIPAREAGWLASKVIQPI